MTTEEYCDIGDLPAAQCGCDKHRGKPEPLMHGDIEAEVEAQFRSACPDCGGRINPGDKLYRIGGQWVCERHAW